MWVVVKLKRNELCVCVKLAEQIGLTVLRDAKMVDLKRLIEESDVFKEDYEFVKTVIKQVLEEIKIQKSKQNSQIELERLKSERAKAELKLAKLRNSANNKESFTTKLRIVVDASAHGRRVLEEVRLANERAHMFSVDPDVVAQPVTVGEEKGLSGDSSNEQLISAHEMCEIEEVKQKVCVLTRILKLQATLYLGNIICVLNVNIRKFS
ncbi:UNVERIFIED_CONTAM: hypothetical protein NCL1_62933 [Trichonephila clavipes]